MSDDFFDDEQELMDASAQAAQDGAEGKAAAAPKGKAARKRKEAAGKGAAAGKDSAADAETAEDAGEKAPRQAPPFWMVLAIAAIALILGVVIGYLVGTQATMAELSAATQSTATSGASTDSSSSNIELPEGHPQLSVDENGNATVADSGSSAQ